MQKIKTIAKYILNTLTIINALLLGIAPIWSIPQYENISATILVITGVISTYLLGQKALTHSE